MSILSKIRNYFNPLSIEKTFTWKYIDLDNDLVEEIKDIYTANLKKDLSDYAFFQVLPLSLPRIMGEIPYAGLVYSPGNHTSKYSHKDPMPDDTCVFALNIPLINCENSLTSLYKSRRNPLYSLYGGRVTEIAKISDCDTITSYCLTQPIMFNTQILHAVDNFSPDPRVAISLRFEKNPIDWI